MAGAQAFRIAVPTFNITLATLPTITSGGAAPGTYWAGFGLDAQGRFQSRVGTGTYPSGEVVTTHLPQWSGLNATYPLMGRDFDVMLSDIDGFWPPTVGISDAIDTWLSLNPGRLWVRQRTFGGLGGNETSVWRVQIRRRQNGTFTLKQADYNVQLVALPP